MALAEADRLVASAVGDLLVVLVADVRQVADPLAVSAVGLVADEHNLGPGGGRDGHVEAYLVLLGVHLHHLVGRVPVIDSLGVLRHDPQHLASESELQEEKIIH